MRGQLESPGAVDDLFVEPVPARPGEFEIGREVEDDAPVDRLLEPRVEVDVGVGGQGVAVFCGLEQHVAQADLGRRRGRRGEQQTPGSGI